MTQPSRLYGVRMSIISNQNDQLLSQIIPVGDANNRNAFTEISDNKCLRRLRASSKSAQFVGPGLHISHTPITLNHEIY